MRTTITALTYETSDIISTRYSVKRDFWHYGTMPATYNLYDDDGESFNYEKGEYSWRQIKVTRDQSGKLSGTIGAAQPGKPNNVARVMFTFMTK